MASPTTHDTTEQGILIELDSRRRVSLGRVGRHERYLAHEERDGTVVLRPAVVMTETEAWLNANPALVDQMVDAIENPAARSTRRGRLQRKGEGGGAGAEVQQ